jgi:hypothetical protein
MKVPKQYCQIFRGTIYQMTTKYTICSVKNIPNGREKTKWPKIYQNLPSQEPPKLTQNLDFWFENKPSGNPVQN